MNNSYVYITNIHKIHFNVSLLFLFCENCSHLNRRSKQYCNVNRFYVILNLWILHWFHSSRIQWKMSALSIYDDSLLFSFRTISWIDCTVLRSHIKLYIHLFRCCLYVVFVMKFMLLLFDCNTNSNLIINLSFFFLAFNIWTRIYELIGFFTAYFRLFHFVLNKSIILF